MKAITKSQLKLWKPFLYFTTYLLKAEKYDGNKC